MKFNVIASVILLAGTVAFAQDADRTKLYGTWQSPQAQNAVWTIQEQGAGVHITNSQGDKKIAEFACDLGKECEVKDEGKKVKITMYFNGPKLVIMETRGENVMKRRIGLAESGNGLEIENIQISPAGKTETLQLTRVQATTATAKP